MNLFKREPELMPQQPQLPQPPAQPARRPQRISEAAAQAAQHVLNLEDQNEELRQQYAQALNHIAVLETYIQDNKRTIAELTAERDDYKHHYSHIYTSLQNAGAILVDCMRAPPRAERNGESDERIQSAVGNLEQQLIIEQVATPPAAAEAGATANAPPENKT